MDQHQLIAIGANSLATSAMLKAGAQQGATGENPVLVACRDADIIAGPIGIVIADALLGEITPSMAAARRAKRSNPRAAACKPLRHPGSGRSCANPRAAD